MENLCHNSELSICTALPLRRIGTPVAISGASHYGGGIVVLNSASSGSGHAGGITPGKLLLVEGATSPHAAITGSAFTVTAGTNGSRLTALSGTPFTGVSQGAVVFIGSGGSNTSPRGQYRVGLTNSSTYIELISVDGTSKLTLTSAESSGTAKTYDLTFYAGADSDGATLNGFPAAGRTDNFGLIGYPLKALACNSGSFTASMAGPATSVYNKAYQVWEVTPGDDGFATGLGPDGWAKTASLRYYRTYRYDWDGTKLVALPGCDYGGKFLNDTAGEKYFYDDIAVGSARVNFDASDAELAQIRGRYVTFGMQCLPPSVNSVRPFIDDGVTVTYGPYFDVNSVYDPADMDASFKAVTALVSTNATRCRVGLAVAGSTGYGYCTQPMAVFGQVLGAEDYSPTRGFHSFTVHPNFAQYWMGGAPTDPTLIRIEQESCGQLPEGLSAIYVGLEGMATAPGSFASGSAAMLLSESAAQRLPCVALYQPQARSSITLGGSSQTLAAGGTRYGGNGALSSGELDVIVRMPFSGTLLNMYTQAGTGPGTSQTFTYTVRKNGVDTDITASTTGASTQASDVIHSVSFSAGDYISLKVTNSASGAATTHNASLSVFRAPDEYVVNCGLAVIGKTTEALSPYVVDSFYVLPYDGAWTGVNIDMYGCQL